MFAVLTNYLLICLSVARSRHATPRTWVWAGVVGWAQSLRAVGGLPPDTDIVVMTLRNDTLVPGVAKIYRGLGIRVVAIPEFAIPMGQSAGGAWSVLLLFRCASRSLGHRRRGGDREKKKRKDLWISLWRLVP